MNYIPTKELSREEWQRARHTGLGGSDVAAALNVNPYKSAVDLYYEKIADEPPKQKETLPMKYGRYIEDVVSKFYCEQTGHKVQKDNKIRIHHQYDFLMANIDRLILKNDLSDTPGILEIKSTNIFKIKEWQSGDYPMPAWLQLQHYFSVSGYTWGAFAVIADNQIFEIFYVERDDELIELMTQKLVKFWTENVLKRVPPPAYTEGDVYRLFPNASKEKRIQATNEITPAINRLAEVKADLKPLEREKESLETQIKLFMMDSEILTDSYGTPLITWKQGKEKECFDLNKFREIYPMIYNKFVTTKPGNRTFLTKFKQGE